MMFTSAVRRPGRRLRTGSRGPALRRPPPDGQDVRTDKSASVTKIAAVDEADAHDINRADVRHRAHPQPSAARGNPNQPKLQRDGSKRRPA